MPPEPQLTPAPQKLNHPLFVWILITIAILAGAFEIYKLYISSKTPENAQNQITQTDTVNWKTYRNEEYGFELQYPSDWKIEPSQAKGVFWLTEIGTEPSFDMSAIYIEVKSENPNFQLTDYLNKEKILLSYYEKDKQIKLDGVYALQSRVVKPGEPPVPIEAGWVDGLVKRTVILKSNSVYIISVNGSDYQRAEIVYDQILSTFKFIK